MVWNVQQELSVEDKTEMARDRVGLGTWEELDDELRQKFSDMEVWKNGVYENYLKEVEEEQMQKMQQMQAKYKKAARRRKGKAAADSEDFEEEYDYVE